MSQRCYCWLLSGAQPSQRGGQFPLSGGRMQAKKTTRNENVETMEKSKPLRGRQHICTLAVLWRGWVGMVLSNRRRQVLNGAKRGIIWQQTPGNGNGTTGEDQKGVQKWQLWRRMGDRGEMSFTFLCHSATLTLGQEGAGMGADAFQGVIPSTDGMGWFLEQFWWPGLELERVYEMPM